MSPAQINAPHLQLFPFLRRLGILFFCMQFMIAFGATATETPSAVIDRYLEKLRGFGYSGAVLVAVNDKIILRKGYGLADVAGNIPNTPQTLFDIGSLSKMLTATAVMRLEADGKLSTNDQISKYFLNTPDDKRSITIGQLLTHTSGVTASAPAYEVIDKDAAIHRIFSAPLKTGTKQLGTDWDYSNADYVLLAAIIESASGEPFEDYMIKHIFAPAGMTATGFWGDRLPRHHHVANGYDETGLRTDLHELSSRTWNDIGSGQIVSNLDDLYHFQKNLFDGTLIPERQLEELLNPVRNEQPSEAYYTPAYGYGMWVNTLPDGSKRYQHGSDFLGFGSQLTRFPSSNTVIVSLCNVRLELFPVHRRADREIPLLLTNSAVAEPPDFIELPPHALAKFLGGYRLSSGDTVTIYRSPSGLRVGGNGQAASQLLNGSYDDTARLAERNAVATKLVMSSYDHTESAPAEVDTDAQTDVRQELQALACHHGAFKIVQTIGSYVGGMTGKFDETLLRIVFEHHTACYRIQWSGAAIVGSGAIRCPALAAATFVEATSLHDLVGWNIITRKSVSLHFSQDFRTAVISSSGHQEAATRIKAP